VSTPFSMPYLERSASKSTFASWTSLRSDLTIMPGHRLHQSCAHGRRGSLGGALTFQLLRAQVEAQELVTHGRDDNSRSVQEQAPEKTGLEQTYK
jgi:hypothetical protein